MSVAGGWLLALGTSIGLIYGVNFPKIFDEMKDFHSQAEHTIYGVVTRLVWGIVLAWVVWACVKGYGGATSILDDHVEFRNSAALQRRNHIHATEIPRVFNGLSRVFFDKRDMSLEPCHCFQSHNAKSRDGKEQVNLSCLSYRITMIPRFRGCQQNAVMGSVLPIEPPLLLHVPHTRHDDRLPWVVVAIPRIL